MPDTAQFDDVARAIGLSVGAAKLAGVAVGSVAVTRSAVLTRFPHRPAEVGLPSENPDLNERGLIITDFVDRVGDPVKIVASDGSSHLGSELLADALCALLYAVTRGHAPVDPVGVTYPVHWRPPAIDALTRALAGLPEFGEPRPAALVPDAVAALIALQDDPGVPTSGIIAVCDFGATGTSITLADAARDFEPIAATVRDPELSGDAVDQALLSRVVADLVSAGSIDTSNTSAIGSLSRLRSQCRAAKERLSTSSVTSITVDLPGRRRDEVRVTRNELDDALAQPLTGFVEILYEELRRNSIHQGDLVAVASVGGGARMPVITTTLSEHLRVPVITTGHPELNAAIGAGLEALHEGAEEGATALFPKATAPRATAPKAATAPVAAPAARSLPQSGSSPPATGLRELTWSGAKDDSGPVSVREERVDDPRPRLEFGNDADADDEPPTPWHHNPFALLAAGVSLVLAATVAAAVFVLVRDDSPTPASTTVSTARATPTSTTQPTPTTQPSTAPQSPAESTADVPPPPPSPLDSVTESPPRTQYTAPASTAVVPPVSPAPSPAPGSSESVPPPSETAPPPPPPEVPPAPQSPPSNTQAPGVPPIPEVPPVPGVPAIPPVPPIP